MTDGALHRDKELRRKSECVAGRKIMSFVLDIWNLK